MTLYNHPQWLDFIANIFPFHFTSITCRCIKIDVNGNWQNVAVVCRPIGTMETCYLRLTSNQKNKVIDFDRNKFRQFQNRKSERSDKQMCQSCDTTCGRRYFLNFVFGIGMRIDSTIFAYSFALIRELMYLFVIFRISFRDASIYDPVCWSRV